MSLLLRTSVEATSLLATVTRVIHELDRAQPIATSTTIRTLVSEELARPRLNALLATGFGLAALALAALGISAALAESMSGRTAELGVRLALGSSPRGLFTLAVRDGLRPALAGTFVGSALSLATTRLIASQLYAVSPWEPSLLAAACTAVLAMSFLACAVPAWRASRTDSASALRHAT
jgi:ABC-type antimicrobial peptide transport system permease subunit